jgi:glycosyltransferase involved in cell wall biosynthesis
MALVQKTWIVVPCYNEAARLDPDAFVSALERAPQLGFVMVDDGSRDATLEILEAFRRRMPEQVTVVALEKNAGKAEAVRRGILHAFTIGAELTGYWDADLATPLHYIETFAELLQNERLQLVIGARVQMLGRRVQRSPMRHYIGRGFGTLAAIALGLPIYDTQCGAKLFRTTKAVHSAFERPFTLRWSFDVEMLGRLVERQNSVGDIRLEEQCAEVPLEEWADAPGSKLTARAFPRIAFELATLLITVRGARLKSKAQSGH